MCLGVRRTWETVPKVQRGATTWWTQSSQIGQVSYHGRPSPSLPRPRVDRLLHCSYIVCMTELRFEWDPKKALSNFTFLRPRYDPLEIPGNRLKDADERGSASPLAFVPSLNIRSEERRVGKEGESCVY